MKAKDYRARARDALRGKWLKTALIVLLALLLGGSVGVITPNMTLNYNMEGNQSISAVRPEEIAPASEEMILLAMVAGIVVVVVLVMLAYSLFLGSYVRMGLVQLGLKVLDGEQPRLSMLFPSGIYWKAVGLQLVKGLFIVLWSLLFVIPGFIAAYRYAMADYILYNNPEISVMEALQESKRRMQGRKWRLLCLEWSFIGWALLAGVPAMIAGLMAETGAFGALMLAAVPAGLIAGCMVDTYSHIASMAFFRDADRAAKWHDEAREGEVYAEKAYSGEADFTIQPSLPLHGQAMQAEPVLNADETVARDMFFDYGCSRRRMREAGVLEEYDALNASPISQMRWKREYGDALMRRFDRDADALDDILEFASEYADAEICDRALSRIERHIRQETLPDDEILNMAGRMLALVSSGAFDENEGFVNRKKQQASDMADRLEHRLNENEAEGEWRKALELIRKMCL